MDNLDYTYKLDIISNDRNYIGKIEYINVLRGNEENINFDDINNKIRFYDAFNTTNRKYSNSFTNDCLRQANLKFDENDKFASLNGDVLTIFLIDGKFTGVYSTVRNKKLVEYIPPIWKEAIDKFEISEQSSIN